MVIDVKEVMNGTSLCANSAIKVISPKTNRIVRKNIATKVIVPKGGSSIHVV